MCPSQMQRIRAHLKNGGVIAYATESCFGLCCDPHNYRAVQKILRIKGRPQSKGLILIASAFTQLESFLALLSQQERQALAEFWPGPTTLLLPAARHAPHWLTGKHDSLAVRVSAHPDAARLCHALNMALVSTSANRAGLRPFKTYAACVKAFGAKVLVLLGRTGQRRRPSTIIDFKSGKIFRK